MAGTLILPSGVGRKLTVAEMENNLKELRDKNAAIGHGHAVADVAGLQPALDGKAAAAHAHALATLAAAGFIPRYEFGTWTPRLEGYPTPGSANVYSVDTGGYYVRLGHMVFLTCHIKPTTIGSMSGYLVLRGFPFSTAQRGDSRGHAIASATFTGLTGIASGSVPIALMSNGFDGAFMQVQNNTGLTLLNANQCPANAEIFLTGSYFAE